VAGHEAFRPAFPQIDEGVKCTGGVEVEDHHGRVGVVL
jgi:hypothetical protein